MNRLTLGIDIGGTFRMGNMNRLTLGIDIGGTFIKYALVDPAFNIIEKWKTPTVKFDTKDEFYDYICSNAKYLDEVDRIGVSAPGLVNEESEIKSYAAPNVVIMFGTNVNEEISKSLCGTKCCDNVWDKR